MKIQHILPAVCGGLLLLAIPSCAVDGRPGPAVASVGVGVGYYDTLPGGWDEPYYAYNGRYYYGGRWETGRYRYHGHYHSGRYFHNGHYYYGGRYEEGHHHHHHDHH